MRSYTDSIKPTAHFEEKEVKFESLVPSMSKTAITTKQRPKGSEDSKHPKYTHEWYIKTFSDASKDKKDAKGAILEVVAQEIFRWAIPPYVLGGDETVGFSKYRLYQDGDRMKVVSKGIKDAYPTLRDLKKSVTGKVTKVDSEGVRHFSADLIEVIRSKGCAGFGDILVLCLFLGETDLKFGNLLFAHTDEKKEGVRALKIDGNNCFTTSSGKVDAATLMGLPSPGGYKAFNWLNLRRKGMDAVCDATERKNYHDISEDPYFRGQVNGALLRVMLLSDDLLYRFIFSYAPERLVQPILKELKRRRTMLEEAAYGVKNFRDYVNSSAAKEEVKKFAGATANFKMTKKNLLCPDLDSKSLTTLFSLKLEEIRRAIFSLSKEIDSNNFKAVYEFVKIDENKKQINSATLGLCLETKDLDPRIFKCLFLAHVKNPEEGESTSLSDEKSSQAHEKYSLNLAQTLLDQYTKTASDSSLEFLKSYIHMQQPDDKTTLIPLVFLPSYKVLLRKRRAADFAMQSFIPHPLHPQYEIDNLNYASFQKDKKTLDEYMALFKSILEKNIPTNSEVIKQLKQMSDSLFFAYSVLGNNLELHPLISKGDEREAMMISIREGVDAVKRTFQNVYLDAAADYARQSFSARLFSDKSKTLVGLLQQAMKVTHAKPGL